MSRVLSQRRCRVCSPVIVFPSLLLWLALVSVLALAPLPAMVEVVRVGHTDLFGLVSDEADVSAHIIGDRTLKATLS